LIPDAVPGDIMTLPLTTSQDLAGLRLDVGGVQLAPTATTNGPGAEDATPPTTVGGGTVSTRGEAALTLLAHDAGGSGVAATYVQLAGAPGPARYTQPLEVPLFSSVDFWSIDAAGNSEDVHTIVVDDTPDVRELATAIATGRPVVRTLWPTGDVDWFSFTAESSSALVAEPDGRIDLDVYDAAGNLVPPSLQESRRRVLPAGTYFARVSGGSLRQTHYVLSLRMARG
jgi:hypothetical protein